MQIFYFILQDGIGNNGHKNSNACFNMAENLISPNIKSYMRKICDFNTILNHLNQRFWQCIDEHFLRRALHIL